MKLLRTILCSLLSLLVLISSSSFTVNMHFCGDHVQSISIIEAATPCLKEVHPPSCRMEIANKKSGCCEDKHVVYEGKYFDTIQDLSLITIQATSWMVIPTLIMEVIQESEALAFSNYTRYKPPIVEHDIPVLIQSFLI